MTQHRFLTDPDVHEPIGISDAASGQIYIADGAGSGAWGSIAGVPVGAVSDFAGSSAPSGWLFCYGQAVSRTTYSALFTALSTTYGVGDGSSTFNLPDCRGRVSAGKDNMGGSSANRLTNPVTNGLDGDTLGNTGGSESHALTTAQLAVHSHSSVVTGASGSDNIADTGSGTTSISGLTVGNSNTAGSGQAHNNVQPTIIFNKIIYAGV